MAALFMAALLLSVPIDANASPLPVDNGYREAVAFNSGWRWVYRKKAVERLVKDVVSDDSIELEALRSALSAQGSDVASIDRAANALIGTLRIESPSEARVLKAVISFLKSPDASALENVIRHGKAGPYHGIGYLLLGRYYEKKGFYPEANGYYMMVKKSGAPQRLSEAALFLSGRALFLQGRLVGAKKAFEASMASGNPLARRWLANTDLIRGEEGLAWELYSDSTGFVPLDPVTRLCLADAMLEKGEFESARRVFAELETLYRDEHLLTSFFSVRKADTYLAQGLIDEAVESYSGLKQKSKGEQWAVASLALADVFASRPAVDARSRASSLYNAIVDGGFIGSEAAYPGLVKMQASLGKYESAVNHMRRFRFRFPASVFKTVMQDIGGEVIHRWTDELYRSGDYYGVTKVDAAFAGDVPFGKKAEGYLKAGMAASELGLLDTAARHLDMAVKVGQGAVAEKAMIGLARVYLYQNDWHGAGRLLDAYNVRFSKGTLAGEAQRLRVLAASLKGDMNKVASSKADPSDAEAVIIKAHALAGIKRYSEASAHYQMAARLFRERNKEDKVVKAIIGGADAGFSSGDYRSAAAGYREALSLLKGQGTDRPWVLYRLAQCYSNLGMADEKDRALKDLASLDGDMKEWAAALFRDSAVQQGKRSGI